MQEFVFFIEGDVNHPLTIDPTVWIFDERKVDVTTYFTEQETKEDEETAYKKAVSAQWDKEIIEGSEPPKPDSNDNKIDYNKHDLLNRSYAMPIKPFLLNTEPEEEIKTVEVVQTDGTTLEYPYSLILSSVAGFSEKGKPLKEDGPIHLYLGDGSNIDEPIRNVVRFVLKK